MSIIADILNLYLYMDGFIMKDKSDKELELLKLLEESENQVENLTARLEYTERELTKANLLIETQADLQASVVSGKHKESLIKATKQLNESIKDESGPMDKLTMRMTKRDLYWIYLIGISMDPELTIPRTKSQAEYARNNFRLNLERMYLSIFYPTIEPMVFPQSNSETAKLMTWYDDISAYAGKTKPDFVDARLERNLAVYELYERYSDGEITIDQLDEGLEPFRMSMSKFKELAKKYKEIANAQLDDSTHKQKH